MKKALASLLLMALGSLATTLTSGAAGVQPIDSRPASDLSFTTEYTGDAPRAHDPAEVRAMAKTLRIDEEQARRRMDIEDAMTGLSSKLRRRWPTFGGVWPTTNQPPKVVAAFAEEGLDASARRREVAAFFRYPETLDVIEVDRSLGELDSLIDRMSSDRRDMATGRRSFHPGAADTRGNYDLSVDAMTNKVLVGLPADGRAQQRAQAFRDTYGAHRVAFETGLVEPDACTRTDCRWTMRGGLELINGTAYCSSAFGAASASGHPYVLSAGHCIGGIGTWRRNGPDGHYGRVDKQFIYGRTDAERIKYERNPWATHGRVFVSSTDIRSICFHVHHSNQEVGVQVGRAARRNTTRGNIIRKDFRPRITEGNSFILASYGDNRDGDSGGAVFRNNDAYGIHHGHDSQGRGVYGAINYAMVNMEIGLLRGPSC